MMLRASVPDPSTDERRASHSALLAALVDAVAPHRPDADVAEVARAAVVDQLGPEWLVDTCAVIANFEMMTRIADGTGARLRPQQLDAAAALIAETGLDTLPSARMGSGGR